MINETNLTNFIANLAFKHRVAFCASVCERQLPYYLKFYEQENFGDFDKLRVVLDDIWLSLAGDIDALGRLKLCPLNVLVELAPDTEDFTSIYTSLAGNAVSTLVYTIEALLSSEKKVDKFVLIANIAIESIYEYISATNDSINSSYITNDETHTAIFESDILKKEQEKQL